MVQTAEIKHPNLTKIVATVASNNQDKEFIRDLVNCGMDVMRLNSAHGTVEEFRKMLALAREVSPNLAVMIDTKGPNIRTSNVPDGGIALSQGDKIKLSGREGTDQRICVNYPSFAEEVPVGSRIVCDDGAVVLKVVGKDGDCLVAEVKFNTTIYNHKSINVPDVSLNAPSLSGRDRDFLAEAARLHCDFVAHSFVRNAADIRSVREALGDAGKDIKIIAKIENREGVDNIHEILEVADGIMVARGDLGIEIPLEEVPAIQKKLIFESRKAMKPVITATQMLQSMETSPSPTRAEVSDVANAVYDGTDAVMLSGETAHGKYPREAVMTMRKIVLEAEKAPGNFFTELQRDHGDNNFNYNVPYSYYLLIAAVHSADVLPVKAVVCNTLSGSSARLCSAFRPRIRIYAPTPDEMVMRQLALSFGVSSSLVTFEDSPEDQARLAVGSVIESGELHEDDLVVILGKINSDNRFNNLLCITSVKNLQDNLGD